MYKLRTAFKSTDFEHELMVNLLGTEDPRFDELRYQYRSSEVVRRERSCFSVITYYKVEDGIKPLRSKNKVMQGFRAEVLESENELSVALYIRNGFLSHIELYDKSGRFPKNPSLLTLYRD
jgi:hypothetical protein